MQFFPWCLFEYWFSVYYHCMFLWRELNFPYSFSSIYFDFIFVSTTIEFYSLYILYNPLDCTLPGSSVHKIFQARIMKWIVISFSRGASQPRDWNCLLHFRWILYHWAFGKAQCVIEIFFYFIAQFCCFWTQVSLITDFLCVFPTSTMPPYTL